MHYADDIFKFGFGSGVGVVFLSIYNIQLLHKHFHHWENYNYILLFSDVLVGIL